VCVGVCACLQRCKPLFVSVRPLRLMSGSSNMFANGANQNCGNVITDRSSTRIHHAPGGASSICLGDSSSYDTFGGDKARKQQPSSIPAQPIPAQHVEPTQTSNVRLTAQQQYAADLKAQIDAKNAIKGQESGARQRGGRLDSASNENMNRANLPAQTFNKDAVTTSSNKFACGANQNAGNVITDRSSTRIHAAPGGNSSLVLG